MKWRAISSDMCSPWMTYQEAYAYQQEWKILFGMEASIECSQWTPDEQVSYDEC